MPVTPLAEPRDADVWPTADRWASDEAPAIRWPAVAVAVFVLLAAFSPSLLPRPWYMQAVATGLGAGIGYLLARLIQTLARAAALLTGIRVVVPRRTAKIVEVLALVVAIGGGVFWWWRSHLAHRETARAVSMSEPSVWDDLLATVAGIAATVVVVLIGLGLRWVWRRISKLLKRFVPKIVARVVAALLIIGLIVWVSNDVLFRGGLEFVSRTAAQTNLETPAGLSAPESELRSGSPEAAQPWEELGQNGMKFTGAGPGEERISEVTGEEAMEPVRVYSSVAGGDMDEIVARAMAEMDRTDAFDRSYVHLVTTTGAGWADEFNVESVEYLTGGDVATVAIQYSYLPSVAALVADRETPVTAGTRMMEAIEAELAGMDEGDRPHLLTSGLSLGAYGGQGAFSSAEEMLERVDGAVWIGTPRFTPVWSDLTSDRRGGSPEIAPVIGDGEHIRFNTRPEELNHDFYGRSFGEWESPRVAYLQYASDPLMWWEPDLIWDEPDWMVEQAGHDVSGRLDWWPLLTFAQISVDTVTGDETPPGHGHIYQDDLVPTWAAVLGGITDDLPDPELHQDIADAIRSHLPQDADDES